MSDPQRIIDLLVAGARSSRDELRNSARIHRLAGALGEAHRCENTAAVVDVALAAAGCDPERRAVEAREAGIRG